MITIIPTLCCVVDPRERTMPQCILTQIGGAQAEGRT